MGHGESLFESEFKRFLPTTPEANNESFHKSRDSHESLFLELVSLF
jgi:hypothetical protein